MIRKNQKGTAMFVALMMLVLSTGLGLYAFRLSLTELQISSYGKNDLAVGNLGESGIEKILFWFSAPDESPDADFFQSLGTGQPARCAGSRTKPDFQLAESLLNDLTSGPFSELKEMGKILDLRLYRGAHPRGLCLVEVTAESGQGATRIVRVELTKSPIQAMTAAIQGAGDTASASPVWAHWGKIRYTGNAHLGSLISRIPLKNAAVPPHATPYSEDKLNEDPWLEIEVEKMIESPLSNRGRSSDSDDNLYKGSRPFSERPNVYENDPSVALDPVDLNDLKRYLKKYGSYYIVSPEGHLEQNGIDRGTFDEVFYPPADDHKLVWIDLLPGYSSSEPIRIGRKSYKGYFYFTGNVQVDGNQPGWSVSAQSPPWPSTLSRKVMLDGINLDGFLYVLGQLSLEGPFSVYGALLAREGFIGPAASELEVWYNNEYRSARYPDLPPIVRLPGTWQIIPVSDTDG